MTAVACLPAVMDPPELAYHRLRAALILFGCGPDTLNERQREVAERRARRSHAVERRVLATRDAAEVPLSDSAVDCAFAAVRDRYGDTVEFEADMARNGLSPETLHLALRRELTAEAVFDRVAMRGPQVGELDVRLYYYLHLERFRQPETRTLRHILITINETFPENREDAARARLGRIRRRLLREPHRFGALAARHSECPSALREGLLGRLPRGKLYPEIDAVAFRLGEGELSEVVRSPVGLHLLVCEQIQPSRTVPLIEARERILAKLRERQRRICINEWLAALPGSTAGD